MKKRQTGGYKFVTDFPGIYPGRPPHIHFKIKAKGFSPLTNQPYLKKVLVK
jgi:protocatechuate 3,4-dioxygenase beta subunit